MSALPESSAGSGTSATCGAIEKVLAPVIVWVPASFTKVAGSIEAAYPAAALADALAALAEPAAADAEFDALSAELLALLA